MEALINLTEVIFSDRVSKSISMVRILNDAFMEFEKSHKDHFISLVTKSVFGNPLKIISKCHRINSGLEVTRSNYNSLLEDVSSMYNKIKDPIETEAQFEELVDDINEFETTSNKRLPLPEEIKAKIDNFFKVCSRLDIGFLMLELSKAKYEDMPKEINLHKEEKDKIPIFGQILFLLGQLYYGQMEALVNDILEYQVNNYLMEELATSVNLLNFAFIPPQRSLKNPFLLFVTKSLYNKIDRITTISQKMQKRLLGYSPPLHIGSLNDKITNAIQLQFEELVDNIKKCNIPSHERLALPVVIKAQIDNFFEVCSGLNVRFLVLDLSKAEFANMPKEINLHEEAKDKIPIFGQILFLLDQIYYDDQNPTAFLKDSTIGQMEALVNDVVEYPLDCPPMEKFAISVNMLKSFAFIAPQRSHNNPFIFLFAKSFNTHIERIITLSQGIEKSYKWYQLIRDLGLINDKMRSAIELQFDELITDINFEISLDKLPDMLVEIKTKFKSFYKLSSLLNNKFVLRELTKDKYEVIPKLIKLHKTVKDQTHTFGKIVFLLGQFYYGADSTNWKTMLVELEDSIEISGHKSVGTKKELIKKLE